MNARSIFTNSYGTRSAFVRYGFRLMLLLGPILFALAVARMLSEQQRYLVLLLILAIPGLLILMKVPPLGLVLLVATAITPPVYLNLGPNTQLSIPLLLIPTLTVLWIFRMVAIDRKININLSAASLAAILLGIVTFMAFLSGLLPWFQTETAPLDAQLGGVGIIVFSVLAFLLAAHHMGDRKWLQRLTWVFIFLGSLHLLVSFFPVIGLARDFFHPMRGSFFILWVVAMAFSQALFNQRLRMVWRIVLLLLVVVSIWVTLFQLRAWASGWMPLLVVISVVLLVGRPRVGLIFASLGALFTILFSAEIIDTVIVSDNLYSLETRVEAWKIIGEIVKVNPVLGLGPSNYYWYTPLYSILGYNVQFNSHNQYVDLIAQIGILGLAVFLWWSFEISRVGWRLRARVGNGFERAFVYGTIGGLAGMLAAGMLGDWVLPFIYNVGLDGFRSSMVGFVFLGSMLALAIRYGLDRRR